MNTRLVFTRHLETIPSTLLIPLEKNIIKKPTKFTLTLPEANGDNTIKKYAEVLPSFLRGHFEIKALHMRGSSKSEDFREYLDVVPDLIRNNLGIKSLYIRNAAFSIKKEKDEKFLKEIAELNIHHLTMNNCSLGDEEVKILAKNDNMVELKLPSNQIGDEGAKCISGMFSLTTLNLVDNQIKDAGLKSLAAISQITQLDIQGNRFSGHILPLVKSRDLLHADIKETQQVKEQASIKEKILKPEVKVEVKTIPVRDTSKMSKELLYNIEKYVLLSKSKPFVLGFFGGTKFSLDNHISVKIPRKMHTQMKLIKKAKQQEKKSQSSKSLWENTLFSVMEAGQFAYHKSKSKDEKRKHFYSLFLPKNYQEFCRKFGIKETDLTLILKTLDK